MKRDPDFEVLRSLMVSDQLQAEGIQDKAVLAAMKKVPRHLFVPLSLRDKSYDNRALPIGPDETISQPYIVALMLEKLALKKTDKVLEIGTGSGYQTALLAELGGEVFSMERDDERLGEARSILTTLGYKGINLKHGDGFKGWEDEGPFDAIIVSAAPDHIPRELVHELKLGGRMILPLGEDEQALVYLEKTPDGLRSEEVGAVRFVPMK